MNPFHGRHFQGEIILWAVRWYCKYGISYRELQEMLAERGVNVDHTTIYRWVQRYTNLKMGAYSHCCPTIIPRRTSIEVLLVFATSYRVKIMPLEVFFQINSPE